MRHLIIGSALLLFVALDVVFVEFSETPSAALVFAVLCYFILLLLSGAAGSFSSVSVSQVSEGNGVYVGNLPVRLRGGTICRVATASVIPVLLLLLLAFIPDFDDPLDPSATVQLGSTLAIFWLLMSLGLVGAVLGFLRPSLTPRNAVSASCATDRSICAWIRGTRPGRPTC